MELKISREPSAAFDWVEKSMAFFTVTYDLNLKKDYEKFRKGIEKVSNNTYVKTTLSQYIIQSSLSATQIRDTLKTYADSDDSIMVLKLDVSDWAYTGLPNNVSSWLQKATEIG